MNKLNWDDEIEKSTWSSEIKCLSATAGQLYNKLDFGKLGQSRA